MKSNIGVSPQLKVAFEAMIKSIQNKSLVSGDKATRIVLEFDSSDKTQILNILNELHRADRTVAVAIAEIEEK
ncbi:MAG: hypothetical protein RBR88_05280 [Candidatus Saccharicenans sp.]|jgi:hypothetical protein|nr:hypothetical protein [Candidatus Saccharicenans sp.]HQM75393.1 hypothetical protein [Candidatus Saccharicenans sp.]